MKRFFKSIAPLFVACLMVPATVQAATLITNGGFEDSLVSNKPPGWAFTVDGSYWRWLDSATASSFVYEGSHAIQRVIFSGQPANSTISSLTSNRYTGVTANTSYRLELSVRTSGQAGKYGVSGIISFYDASNNLLQQFQTESTGSATWTQLSVVAVAPENAVSFTVSGHIAFTQAITGTAYVAFDSFEVTAVPEPSSVALIAGLGAICFGYRAATHRKNQ